MGTKDEKKRRENLNRRLQSLEQRLDADRRYTAPDVSATTKAGVVAKAKLRLAALDGAEAEAGALGPNEAGVDPVEAIHAHRVALTKLIEDLTPQAPGDGAELPATPGGSPPASEAVSPVAVDMNGQSERPPATVSRTIATVRVADLKPNRINSEVFMESLGDAAIAELAADIQIHGLRQPIEVKPDLTIIDGERRWRALVRNKTEFTDVFVIDGVVTESDLAAYILDAQQTTRQTTVREKLNLYNLAISVLKERHGRPPGRPGKSVRTEQVFWPAEQIEAEAAKKAGFTSPGLAKKAEHVFSKGDAELVELVNSDEVAISTAYDRLLDAASPKSTGPRTRRSKARKAATASTTPSPVATDPATHGVVPGVDSGGTPLAAVTPASATQTQATVNAAVSPAPVAAERGNKDADPTAVEVPTGDVMIPLLPDSPGADPRIETYNKAVNLLVNVLQQIARTDDDLAKKLVKALPERLKAPWLGLV